MSRPGTVRAGPDARPGVRPTCAVLAAVMAAAIGAAPATGQELPDTVLVEDPGLHPEGVEWDGERQRFLVSSVTRGTVTAVRDDGDLQTLVDDVSLTSTIGVHIDEAHGRVLVADADVAAVQGDAQGHARLGIYELASGERLHMAELTELHDGRHFANDVTAGPDGSAYVTDSFSPVIYRVGPEGEASVFLEDPRLGGEGFGLNGIDHHPDGFLLVAMAGDRTLYRVPLDAPGELSEVELSEPFEADGLHLREDGALVAVAITGEGEEQQNEALVLRSEDGWASARIVDRAPAPGATTATVRDGAVYVVNPHFADMGGGEPTPAFEIYRPALER